MKSGFENTNAPGHPSPHEMAFLVGLFLQAVMTFVVMVPLAMGLAVAISGGMYLAGLLGTAAGVFLFAPLGNVATAAGALVGALLYLWLASMFLARIGEPLDRALDRLAHRICGAEYSETAIVGRQA